MDLSCTIIAGVLYVFTSNSAIDIDYVNKSSGSRHVYVVSHNGSSLRGTYPNTDDYQTIIDMNAIEWLQWCHDNARQ